MKRYHMRRREKQIRSWTEIERVIRSQKYLTLALGWNKEPYLVSLNYGYDRQRRIFYFHCAQRGKKIDILRQNPVVWGQIIDDRGYRRGDCDHDFRTVQFRGRVRFLRSLPAMRRAMSLMTRQLEPRPQRIIRTLSRPQAFRNALIGQITASGFTGKKYIK